MSSDTTSSNIDRLSLHEAIDRSWVVLSTLESILGEHPVVQTEQEIKVLYDKSVEALAELYQKLGQLYL